jgi:hypothetical protein
MAVWRHSAGQDGYTRTRQTPPGCLANLTQQAGGLQGTRSFALIAGLHGLSCLELIQCDLGEIR